MIYILFLYLLLLFIIFFISFGGNILSPSVIATGMFLISTFFALINVNKWKFELSEITVLLIIISLIFFAIGEYIAYLFFCHGKKINKLKKETSYIYISTSHIFFISFLLLFLLFHYYKQTELLAIKNGYHRGSGALMLLYVRNGLISAENTVSRDRLANYSLIFARAVAYVFLYIYIYNVVFFKRRKWVLIIPILIYAMFIVLSTSRILFINLFTVVIIVTGIFYLQKNQWNTTSSLKIAKFGIIFILFFLVLFTVFGLLRGVDSKANSFDIISSYIGLSIPSLDRFLLTVKPVNSVYGGQTFRFLYNILSKFGYDTSSVSKFYDFTYFGKYGGNVYTVVRTYFEEFGLIGLIFFMLFDGIFFSFFFYGIQNKRSVAIILYADLFQSVVMFGIAETFFSSVLSSELIYDVIFIILLYDIFVKKHKSKMYVCKYKECPL